MHGDAQKCILMHPHASRCIPVHARASPCMPGHTAQTETLGLSATARAVGSLKYFVMSPNLVWFAMALGFHLLAPYPIAQAREQGPGDGERRRLCGERGPTRVR